MTARTGSTLEAVQDAIRMCFGATRASVVAIELPILGWPAPVITNVRPWTAEEKVSTTCALVAVASNMIVKE